MRRHILGTSADVFLEIRKGVWYFGKRADGMTGLSNEEFRREQANMEGVFRAVRIGLSPVNRPI